MTDVRGTQDSDGLTALHLAAMDGYTTILQALVAAVPPAAREKTGGLSACTALMCAACCGHVQAIQVGPLSPACRPCNATASGFVADTTAGKMVAPRTATTAQWRPGRLLEAS